MKKENTEVSRREFLTKGAAVVAATGATIIAIQSTSHNVEARELTSNQMMTNDPVFTESTQTLTNKTISSRYNTLGADDVFVKEFISSGVDITSSLNSAISYLTGSGKGGRILIPQGSWTTNGGHEFGNSISIEGVGVTSNGPYIGTKVSLNESASNYVFRISANTQNCSLKNMHVDMTKASSATGLLMTNHHNETVVGTNIYFTAVENVQFWSGAYGIKVESQGTTNFECIMNRFEKVSFFQCSTSFYCNSINGGYLFDTCYFQLATPSGTGLDCQYMGSVALENCLFVGVSKSTANVPPSDGSTILKTFGAYNNINFHNCQDENVEYYYQNSTNYYLDTPISFKDCIIQASFKYTASGSVIFDSCRINVTDIGSGHITISDTNNAFVYMYLKGGTEMFEHFDPMNLNPKFENFTNAYSRTIFESNEVGLLEVALITDNSATFVRNATRGAVNVKAGTSYTVVYNNLITTDSLVFAQLRSYDSGGARIREVQCNNGFFQINLNQNAASNLSVAFKVEGTNF